MKMILRRNNDPVPTNRRGRNLLVTMIYLFLLGVMVTLAGCGGGNGGNGYFAILLVNFSVDPATVAGGQTVTGTVTSNSTDPGGLTVILSSANSAVASMPASVVIAVGQKSASFTITTSSVPYDTPVVLTAVGTGDLLGTQTATLMVQGTNGPSLSSLTLNPTTIPASATSTGTVTVTTPAPTGGSTINLASANTAVATVPPSVVVPAGQTSATFTVTPQSVPYDTPVVITAGNALKQSLNATLLVQGTNGPALTSLTVSPAGVTGSQPSVGTVTFDDVAPSGGIVVNLSSANTAVAATPTSVTVPAGQSSATFPITTTIVAKDTPVTLTATATGQTQTATLTVQAAVLASLTLSPNRVYQSSTTTGTVTLTGPPLTGGMVVTLSSPDTSPLRIPATVTIPAGINSVTFPITVGSVTANTTVTLSATLKGVTQTANLLVLHTPAFDFYGDGNNDLLFQNSQTAAVSVWFMNGLTVNGSRSLDTVPAPGWVLVGSGDFNNDGQPDLVFQNETTGNIEIWYMKGTTVLSKNPISTEPDAGWNVVATGDFNGDGIPDLVFQNQTSGKIVFWFMNGATVTGGIALGFEDTPEAGWKVVGTGDFNGDLQPDLLFQNSTTGELVVWYMSGTNVIGGEVLPGTPEAGWQVKGVADYNNDGSADIVFQNGMTNQVVLWFMKDVEVVGGALISTQPPAPNVLVGPH